ncbi:MAG: LD-carboxypeptidase [Desulfopila sp.]
MGKVQQIPPPLRPGDVVGIAAPAGQIVDQKRFQRGVAILADLGFEPRFPREMWPGPGYLADTDRRRAQELHELIADPEVAAIIAARGGYGCLRLLAHCDTSLWRQHPKALVGFSDISALLNHVVQQTGLLCFHGPVVTSLADLSRDGLERFYACLTGNWQRTISPSRLEVLRADQKVAQGPLIGGNLSTLMTLIGTPYDVDWHGCIVVLEDVGEPLYRLDRMLTQLALAGKLQQVAGLVLGDFTLNNNQELREKIRSTEYVWQRVLDLSKDGDFPVWGNFPAGHCPENLTLPLGAWASMDSGRGLLSFR